VLGRGPLYLEPQSRLPLYTNCLEESFLKLGGFERHKVGRGWYRVSPICFVLVQVHSGGAGSRFGLHEIKTSVCTGPPASRRRALHCLFHLPLMPLVQALL
jgi:hypothetical protein